ncbi:DUF4365 domain-containing protein [Pseudomonas putida]|uniref:DUF4365 domain-containing protein n=1 Tax=Pseudomonas putida TaxID=303 RepID=UPI003F2DE92F
MPVEGPLPQTGDQHDINADAERCLRGRCPRDWRLQSLEGTDDYGFDFQVQTTPNQQATDIFRIQLKGTRSPQISSDQAFISISLKASTIRYYDRAVEPVLLVICDLAVAEDPLDCPLYYAWVRDELDRIQVSDLPAEQKYVTLRARLANRLTIKTNLASEIARQNEYSRAGHVLSRHTEQTHPQMPVEERLSLVQGALQGITARGGTFIEALAAPVDGHWLAPKPGTLAWHLSQAKAELRVNALSGARTLLDSAELMLGQATSCELAEYWCLRGHWEVEEGTDEAASSAYHRAYQANPLAKYLTAWVEAEIRIRFDSNPASLDELHTLLEGDDPLVVFTKSRLAAIQGDYSSAHRFAETLPAVEQHSAKALAFWLARDYPAVVACCEQGLSFGDRQGASHHMLLLLRARAKFTLAHTAVIDPDNATLPATGLPGVDPGALRDAWTAIEAAVTALRTAGWTSNIEHIADIWPATALALGKAASILPLLTEATRIRPHLPGIREALRAVAADCRNFELALSANDALPPSDTQQLWAVLLSQELGKHRLCVQHFQRCVSTVDHRHPMWGAAAVAAILSAQRMVQPDLVHAWLAFLQAHAELAGFAAQATYYLAIEDSPIAKQEALEVLHAAYEQGGQPHDLALTLLQELDPAVFEQAQLCVQVAQRITRQSLLSPHLASRLGVALITLKEWQALVSLCQDGSIRAEPGDRMLAFEALALDHLGRSNEARDRLAGLLAGGSDDQVALDKYVTIATRCGYVHEAIDAAERFLEVAESKDQRRECLRLLYSLIQFADPTSSRLRALALEVGELVDCNDERQEGGYLVMFIASAMGGVDVDLAADRERFQQRAQAFFKKFPNSSILRKGELRADSTPAECLSAIKALAGITDDREALQRRLEKAMQQGFTAVPFAWRPRLALSGVSDVVHLWELAKLSSRDDLKYHLSMMTDPDRPCPSALDLRQRVPILDLTALLVVHDLGLIEELIAFFGTIAISKITLEELVELSSPLFGSPMRERCLALQQALKPHLGAILQPSSVTMQSKADHPPVLGRANAEIVDICTTRPTQFRLYSDDSTFRIFAAGGAEPDGTCTLDVLNALVEAGQLTPHGKAVKIAQLCRWKVGVLVNLVDFMALIPPALFTAKNVRHGVQIIDAADDLMEMIAALWDFRLPFSKNLHHAAAILRLLITVDRMSDVAIAALMQHWFVKAAMKSDAPSQAVRALCQLAVTAAREEPLEPAWALRLWRIYLLLVETHHGPGIDDARFQTAIRSLGIECARLQHTSPGEGEQAVSALANCLTKGAIEQSLFCSGYSAGLAGLA